MAASPVVRRCVDALGVCSSRVGGVTFDGGGGAASSLPRRVARCPECNVASAGLLSLATPVGPEWVD